MICLESQEQLTFSGALLHRKPFCRHPVVCQSSQQPQEECLSPSDGWGNWDSGIFWLTQSITSSHSEIGSKPRVIDSTPRSVAARGDPFCYLHILMVSVFLNKCRVLYMLETVESASSVVSVKSSQSPQRERHAWGWTCQTRRWEVLGLTWAPGSPSLPCIVFLLGSGMLPFCCDTGSGSGF